MASLEELKSPSLENMDCPADKENCSGKCRPSKCSSNRKKKAVLEPSTSVNKPKAAKTDAKPPIPPTALKNKLASKFNILATK